MKQPLLGESRSNAFGSDMEPFVMLTMVDNTKKKPTETVVVVPPSEAPKKNGQPKKFRRCRSAPNTEIVPKKPQPGSATSEKRTLLDFLRPKLRQISLILVLFLGVGTLIFYLVRHQIKGKKTNDFLDALYFSVVTMTTVGYGDLFPNSTTTKLLASVYVFIGMALCGLFLSKAANYFVENQEELLVRALHIRSKVSEVDILNEIKTNRVKNKLIVTTAFLLILMLIGTLFLWKNEKLSLIDSFYCVCSTITTLGYGEKSFTTPGGRVFALFWIFAGTIVVIQFFFCIVELHTEHKQQALAKLVIKRRMTYFDLQEADMDSDGIVDAAEFIIYKLKELGKITQEDIALILDEFEDLDVDQSGTISAGDLLLSQPSQ